jgi:hypothetical protein
MHYRKKPDEVDAVQMPTKGGDFTFAPEWVREAMEAGALWYVADDAFNVLEKGRKHFGSIVHCGRAGDFLVRNVAGELYVVPRTKFLAMWEPIGSVAPLVRS